MQNWKTTVLGILTGIGLLSTAGKMIMSTGLTPEACGLIAAGIGAILHGVTAQDAQKVSRVPTEEPSIPAPGDLH